MEKDLDELLDALVWAHKIVELDDARFYVFRPLSLEQRNMASFLYEKSKRVAKIKGLKTKEELKKIAIEAGTWISSYDQDLKLLKEELGSVLSDIEEEKKDKMLTSDGKPKRTKPTSKLIKLTKRQEYLAKTIKEIESSYIEHIELPSSEYYAERERGAYYLSCTTLTFPEMNRVWKDLGDLKNETDTTLVAALMNKYYNAEIATESEIRRLARSGMWRVKWLGSKKNRGVKTLFGRDMYDITIDQFRLVYWSQIYDSAFESMDPPSDEVIENDRLFDKWLDEQSEKRKQERKSSELNEKITSSKAAGNAQEVGFDVTGFYCEECTCGVSEKPDSKRYRHAPSCPYGVFVYYNHETRTKKADEVQAANPESIRKLLGREQKALADAGADGVEEQHLRSDHKVRSMLGMQTKQVGKDDPRKRR